MARDLGAVLFDLDDTLHDDTYAYQSAAREVCERIATAHGIEASAVFDVYLEKAQAFWKELSVDHLTNSLSDTRTLLWARALAAVGIEGDEHAREAAQAYADSRPKYYAPFPGTLRVLDTLRRRGMRLGLVTNGFASTHYDKLKLLGLESAFEVVVMADEVGMVKPDPRIFLHACEQLATPPARTAMVGDRIDRDIAGAQAAGLFTIYLDRHGEGPRNGTPPDAVIRTIDEVLEVLA